MQPLLVALLLLGVAARPAQAGAILYATAASAKGVDGFCIHGDGSLASTPDAHADTEGDSPRRLVLGSNGVLYVVEIDRVEAYQIGPHGSLARLGRTKVFLKPRMNAYDVALNADATMLYVPQSGQDLIGAYPIGSDGAPAEDFTSCIKGPPGSRFQHIMVRDGLLYVTAGSLGGRVAVFPIDPDGNLQGAPTDCSGKSATTCPLSERRKLLTPRAFVTAGELLYVESLVKHRLFVFQLTNGLFDPPVQKKTGAAVSACLKDDAGNQLKGPFKYQAPSSKTAAALAYQDLVLSGSVLLASQFAQGRVDAFRLRPDGGLGKQPIASTQQDLRGSPVGLAIRGDVLYVAGGELDRVQAYRLGRERGLPEATPFSQTAERKSSFPNALAIVELPEECK